MRNVNVRRYPNGFELRYMNVPLNIITGSVVVEVGAGYEQPEEYGISHFVEHTVMRGGTSKLSSAEATMITSRLGYANAATSVRNTTYDGKFLPDDLDLYLRFVSDITYDATFDPRVVEEERTGIIAERGQKRNDPNNVLYDALFASLFEKSPARRNSAIAIVGPLENIQTFQQPDLRRYHQRWTKRENSVLYLMGPLPENIEERVEEYFGQEDTGFKCFEYQKESPVNGIDRNEITRKGAERTTIIMVWHVPPEEDYENGIKLDMTASVMGGDFTSGLLHELRIKRGLVYSAGAGYGSIFNQGFYFVQTDVEPGKERDVEEIVLDHIDQFQRGQIDSAFFERQQRRKAYAQAAAMDTPANMFEMMRTEKRLGCDPMSKLDIIRSLTVDDIQKVSEYLNRERYLFFTESPE